MSDTKKKLSNLSKETATIFGAAMAALTGFQSNAAILDQNVNLDNNSILVKENSKIKPMPVLKLNFANSENSIFVAQHTSHSSHSSHRSHYSHRSAS